MLTLLVGVTWVLRFDQTAGASGNTPRHLRGAAGQAARERAGEGELRVFLHPRCPCSQATLEQLRKVLREADGPVRLTVYLYRPRDSRPEWSVGALRKAAAGLASAQLRDDPGGMEAERFGALTSGHVVLYGPEGALRFSGGITDGRGQFGRSSAAEQLAAAIRGMRGAHNEVVAPVYGCPIRTPGEKR